MKVLITGGSGYLAWEIIRQIKQNGLFSIIASSSNPEKLADDDNYKGVELIPNNAIWDTDILDSVEIIIHTAFCRKSNGGELVKSLIFSQKLFQKAVSCEVGAIINLSSQSVYGCNKEGLPTEDGLLEPDYLYAMAKASSELLLESVLAGSKVTYTNVRLASLMGPSKDVPVNVLYKFVENSLNGKDICIQGGKQNFSFLDVRDAAEAIIGLLSVPYSEWYSAYNLGPEKLTNIKDLAQIACDCAVNEGMPAVRINLEEDDTKLNAGMNSARIYGTLRWTPRFSIEDTVEATVEYICSKGENTNAKN